MTVAPILRATYVQRTPAETFALFTDRIGAWWPLRTHGTFGARAGGLEFRDGHLVERSLGGEEAVWGEVLEWQPPARLVITWHPGRPADRPSVVEVSFLGDGTGTRVELCHRGWEVFGDEAATRRDVYVGPGTWGSVLDTFTDLGDKLAPATDTVELAAAYDTFFAAAGAGGFGPPPAGEWSAEEVVAHVALNDDAMSAQCRALIHGAAEPFTNVLAIDPARLAELCDGRDLATLVELGRRRADQLLALLARLNPAQLSTPVHCTLRDGDELMVDAPIEWATVALRIQPARHLPAHTAQLHALRA